VSAGARAVLRRVPALKTVNGAGRWTGSSLPPRSCGVLPELGDLGAGCLVRVRTRSRKCNRVHHSGHAGSGRSAPCTGPAWDRARLLLGARASSL